MPHPAPHGIAPEAFERFGELLRYLRLRARLTQRELSIAVGYNYAQISRLESGQRLPDPAVIRAVFIPALELSAEPAWAARLVELADNAARQALDRSLSGARADTPASVADAPQVPVAGPQPVAAAQPGFATPLLATKLYVPQLRTGVVVRPRLLRQLDAALTAPLTLVAAGAGFGKTTLLTSWLAVAQGSKRRAQSETHQTGPEQSADGRLDTLRSSAGVLQVGWLSLDASDNDTTAFLRYLIAALQTMLPAAGHTALALLQLPQPPPPPLLLTTLLNDLTALPGPSVLVLDDYHMLSDPAIHAAVQFLVEHMPPALHLLIASRVEPPLPLARLRARGEIVELRAGELRFTTEEAYALLHDALGAAVTPEEARVLGARTEGWAAGLQLAALALRDRADREGFLDTFTGNNRYIADYLAAEVLAQLPAHLRAFVLQTSILERLCGSLCDAVLDLGRPEAGREGAADPAAQEPAQAYSQLVLAELERAQLFVVPLDSERRWYRYHHLFAEVLRAQLLGGAGRAEIERLHRRAAAWYERQGLVVEAINHALRGRDWEWATALIEADGLPLLVRGQLPTVMGWLQALPEGVLLARPLLSHGLATGLMLSGQFAAALAALDRAVSHLPPELPDDLAGIIQVRLSGLRGHIALMVGDPAEGRLHYQRMMSFFPETVTSPRVQRMIDITRAAIDVYGLAMDYQATGDTGEAMERRAEAGIAAAQRTSNHAALRNACTYLASLQQLQGRLRAAAATYARFESLAPTPEALQAGFGTPAYYVGIGELECEWDDLEAAEHALTRAMAHIRGGPPPDAEVVLRSHLALARLYQARGSAATAHATLDAFRQLARERELAPALIGRAAAAEARLHLAQGRLDAALRWAAGLSLPTDAAPLFPHEGLYLALARVQIAAGEAPQTAQLLVPLLADAERCGRGRSVIEVLMLQALAADAAGQPDGALAALEQALQRAEPEGYLRLFLDEGPALTRLLVRLAAHHDPGLPLHGYIRRLLQAAAPQH